jgi:hypothetical protein
MKDGENPLRLAPAGRANLYLLRSCRLPIELHNYKDHKNKRKEYRERMPHRRDRFEKSCRKYAPDYAASTQQIWRDNYGWTAENARI